VAGEIFNVVPCEGGYADKACKSINMLYIDFLTTFEVRLEYEKPNDGRSICFGFIFLYNFGSCPM